VKLKNNEILTSLRYMQPGNLWGRAKRVTEKQLSEVPVVRRSQVTVKNLREVQREVVVPKQG
jgi:hypothetical protein